MCGVYLCSCLLLLISVVVDLVDVSIILISCMKKVEVQYSWCSTSVNVVSAVCRMLVIVMLSAFESIFVVSGVGMSWMFSW